MRSLFDSIFDCITTVLKDRVREKLLTLCEDGITQFVASSGDKDQDECQLEVPRLDGAPSLIERFCFPNTTHLSLGTPLKFSQPEWLHFLEKQSGAEVLTLNCFQSPEPAHIVDILQLLVSNELGTSHDRCSLLPNLLHLVISDLDFQESDDGGSCLDELQEACVSRWKAGVPITLVELVGCEGLDVRDVESLQLCVLDWPTYLLLDWAVFQALFLRTL